MDYIKVKERTHVLLESWMINDLQLRGNELVCFAIIYGFSQDGESMFNGSRKYIASWLGCSLPTADKVIASLLQQNLIIKSTETRNGVIFNSYKANISLQQIATYATVLNENSEQKRVGENFIPYKESLYPPKEFLHDNNSNNNSNIKKKENNKKKKETDELFEKCWIAYNRKGSKKKSKEYWDKLSDDEKNIVMPHVNAYVASRELSYQKDFERYLRDKIFFTVVFNKNQVIYDPTRISNDEYRPELSPLLMWSDFNNCYMYIGGYFDGHISDGYDDNNRPNGARITLNNGRGVIVWNSNNKKWEKQ